MCEYLCPDCDGAQMEFLRVSAAGVHFFCYYCRRDVLVADIRPEYLPNRILTLNKEYPARREEEKKIAVA